MKPVPESHGMNEPAHRHLGLGIFRMHRRHDLGTLLRIDVVHHFNDPLSIFSKCLDLLDTPSTIKTEAASPVEPLRVPVLTLPFHRKPNVLRNLHSKPLAYRGFLSPL
jgi:hypothetical protein